jgi:biopolymer transport protein TolR
MSGIVRKRKKVGPKSDINITPFIDILLVLLVIFMVITPLTPTGLDAAVPQPPPPGSPPPDPDALNKTIIVTIDDAGVIKVNQDVVDTASLGTKLQDIFRTRNERVMFINAHPDLIYNDVVTVIDISKGAGVDKVGLMTEQITAAAAQ